MIISDIITPRLTLCYRNYHKATFWDSLLVVKLIFTIRPPGHGHPPWPRQDKMCAKVFPRIALDTQLKKIEKKLLHNNVCPKWACLFHSLYYASKVESERKCRTSEGPKIILHPTTLPSESPKVWKSVNPLSNKIFLGPI